MADPIADNFLVETSFLYIRNFGGILGEIPDLSGNVIILYLFFTAKIYTD